MRYITRQFCKLSEHELELCSELFSKHYGKYNGKDGKHEKGSPIKMNPSVYKRFYSVNPDYYISMCFSDSEELIGQAIFLRKTLSNNKKATWVTQLVVHNRYRNRKVGSKLLLSAWGFSDYYAWGLATCNAITLKTLESVTWRKISPEKIVENKKTLEELLNDIPFIESKFLKISKSECQVFSNFYPEIENVSKDETLSIYATKLGKLNEGNEWLAFTFAEQPFSISKDKFNDFIEFSDSQLKEAYSRMEMPEQPWTKGTAEEISFIVEKCKPALNSSILDLGCGQGRHSIELSKRKFSNVLGIDFTEKNICSAKKSIEENHLSCSFVEADARKLRLGKKFDLILCLYDVIGSFRNEEDNLRILRTIKNHLKKDGKAVISVMNMELTSAICTNKVNLSKNPQALLALPPSDTMQSSGNVFKPEYFLINTEDSLVYRKEQFTNGIEMSGEYVVVDKRYTKSEFLMLLDANGLKAEEVRYVQAGKWSTSLAPTDIHAKEILFVVTGK